MSALADTQKALATLVDVWPQIEELHQLRKRTLELREPLRTRLMTEIDRSLKKAQKVANDATAIVHNIVSENGPKELINAGKTVRKLMAQHIYNPDKLKLGQLNRRLMTERKLKLAYYAIKTPSGRMQSDSIRIFEYSIYNNVIIKESLPHMKKLKKYPATTFTIVTACDIKNAQAFISTTSNDIIGKKIAYLLPGKPELPGKLDMVAPVLTEFSNSSQLLAPIGRFTNLLIKKYKNKASTLTKDTDIEIDLNFVNREIAKLVGLEHQVRGDDQGNTVIEFFADKTDIRYVNEYGAMLPEIQRKLLDIIRAALDTDKDVELPTLMKSKGSEVLLRVVIGNEDNEED